MFDVFNSKKNEKGQGPFKQNNCLPNVGGLLWYCSWTNQH